MSAGLPPESTCAADWIPVEAGGQNRSMTDRRPDRSERIVILGAGPAGLHMGYELKKRGFDRVTVFEKLPRLGGKVRTFYDRDLPIDLGAVLLPGRTQVRELCSALGVELLQLPRDRPLTRPRESGMPGSESGPMGLPELAAEYRPMRALIGDLKGTITSDTPDDSSARLLSGSFAALLKKSGFPRLNAACSDILYAYGYGTCEDMAAYYGVLFAATWLPDIITLDWWVAKDGYASVMDRMAAVAGLEVVFSTEALRIDEEGRSVSFRRRGEEFQEPYDFLINSIPHLICGPSAQPVFGQMEMVDYRVSVLKGRAAGDLSEMSGSGEANEVNFIAHPANLRGRPHDPDGRAAYVAYQAPDYGLPKQTSVDLGSKLMDDLVKIHGRNPGDIEILHQETWPYFPRFSAAQIAQKTPWRIGRMQGDHRTWHIGASCCFESVANVIDYNLELLSRFKM